MTTSSLLKKLFAFTLFLGLVGGLTACSRAPYVWAGDIPVERARPEPAKKTIQPGDVVALSVVGQPELSGQQTVSADGTILVMNLGPIAVGGMTPSEGESVLELKLKHILAEPDAALTVVLRHIEVTVMGEVLKPGKYVLESGDGVATAVAMAGGITPFGHQDRIFLVRTSEPQRIRFRLNDVVQGGGSAQAFALRDSDLLYVE